jgi:hypothetical protein
MSNENAMRETSPGHPSPSRANYPILRGPDWQCVNPQASWQGRDSQGYFVHENKMWMFGGWYSGSEPAPRDVWHSVNGKQWTLVTDNAPWTHGDMPACMAHGGRMWLMGGRDLPTGGVSNKVWSSIDGAAWTLEGEADWSPRVCHAYAVFRGRMWILGGVSHWGEDSDATLSHDIWSSADGKTWRCEVEAAPWRKRRDARVFVYRDQLWLIGGGAQNRHTDPLTDIWRSDDGVNWELVSETVPWAGRLWFAQAVYRDRIWILGGWLPEPGNYNDIWFTEDGKQWTEVKCDKIWKQRHQPAVYVFEDKIWIAGGHAVPVSNEVWSWRPPDEWFA